MCSLRGKAYNLGLSDANISKRQLCEVIKQHISDFVYFESEVGSDPDKRDYIVSNDRIEKSGFKATRSLSSGISELVKALPLLKRILCEFIGSSHEENIKTGSGLLGIRWRCMVQYRLPPHPRS